MEAWGDWLVTPRWRLSPGFRALEKSFRIKPGVLDLSAREAEGVDPELSGLLRSQWRASERFDLDLTLRAVSETPPSRAGGYLGAPGYVDLDARAAFRLTPSTELSVTGVNLLDESRPQAAETRRSEVRRTVWAGLRWSF